MLNYLVDGTLSDADDGILMPGCDPVPKGKPVQGRMFPLVLDLDALPDQSGDGVGAPSPERSR